MPLVTTFAPASNRFRSRGLALSAAAGAGCALATVAQAQIVFSGAQNLVSSGSYTAVDFNFDGTVDTSFYSKGFVDRDPGQTAAFVSVVASGKYYPTKLSGGTQISSASTLNPSFSAMALDSSHGGWNTGDTGYIGFSFVKGASTYYGWGLVNYTSGATYTLVDWAYNSTAGDSITAGQMPTVPEPAATALLAGAAALLGGVWLKKRRRARAAAKGPDAGCARVHG